MELCNIGIPEMKIANLFEDVQVLKDVQDLAMKIIAEDSNLEENKNVRLKSLIANKFTGRIEM